MHTKEQLQPEMSVTCTCGWRVEAGPKTYLCMSDLYRYYRYHLRDFHGMKEVSP